MPLKPPPVQALLSGLRVPLGFGAAELAAVLGCLSVRRCTRLGFSRLAQVDDVGHISQKPVKRGSSAAMIRARSCSRLVTYLFSAIRGSVANSVTVTATRRPSIRRPDRAVD